MAGLIRCCQLLRLQFVLCPELMLCWGKAKTATSCCSNVFSWDLGDIFDRRTCGKQSKMRFGPTVAPMCSVYKQVLVHHGGLLDFFHCKDVKEGNSNNKSNFWSSFFTWKCNYFIFSPGLQGVTFPSKIQMNDRNILRHVRQHEDLIQSKLFDRQFDSFSWITAKIV